MDKLSIFTDKTITPTLKDVEKSFGSLYKIWKHIYDMVYEQYPKGKDEWNFPGKNYGWSFRIKDKKRAILYFLPRENYFYMAFVFGDKALAQIMETDIAQDIKNDLQAAKKYAEGRGIRIKISDNSKLPDIKKLIEIKLNN